MSRHHQATGRMDFSVRWTEQGPAVEMGGSMRDVSTEQIAAMLGCLMYDLIALAEQIGTNAGEHDLESRMYHVVSDLIQKRAPGSPSEGWLKQMDLV